MTLNSKILLLLVPAIALPLIFLGVVANNDRQEDLGKNAISQMKTSVSEFQNMMSAQLINVRSNVKLLANSHIVDQYVRIEDEERRYRLMYRPIISLFDDYQRVNQAYVEIRLLLADGYEDVRLTARPLVNIKENEFDSEWFQQLVGKPDELLQTYYINPDDNVKTLLIAKRAGRVNNPSRSEEDYLGFIAINLDLSFLQRYLDSKTIGNSGYFLVVDEMGKVQFQPKIRALTSTTIDAKYLAEGTFGGVVTGKVFGASYYVSVNPLVEGLYVVALWPVREIQALEQEYALRTILQIIVTLLVTAMALFWLLRVNVIKPIRLLQGVAERIGAGDWDVNVQIKRNDEIGQLANSVSNMRANLHSATRSLEHFAYRDGLTGLSNRLMFLREIQAAIDAKDGRVITLLFIDLDGFKEVNDTEGHSVGDLVLREVGDRLLQCVEGFKLDFEFELARIGGDEFCVLMLESRISDMPEKLAKAVNEGLELPFKYVDNTFHLSSSIGIARYGLHGNAPADLLRHADIAMYEAKKLGRGLYMVYSQKMSEQAIRRHSLQSDLREAMVENQLHLNYQPQISVENETLVGCEALIRWTHPTKGMISPVEFIPIAVESGLIAEVGNWVITESCRQLGEWQAKGLKPVKLSVNVSGTQFEISDLQCELISALQSHGVAPSLFAIEITETEIMHLDKSPLETLQQIKDMGISIALDDFGTGYSSLNALKQLPIDCLKIDKSFVDAIGSENGEAIIRAISAMCQQLSLNIVAEGVEDEVQLEFLRTCQCDVIQGYYYSKPVDANAFARLLQSWDNSRS